MKPKEGDKSKKESKPVYSPVSHNILVFQSMNFYMVQTLIKKDDGYSIEFYSTAGNQFMRQRVIEQYRKEDHHPFVRALHLNHGQEMIQVDPDCNNAFYYKIPGKGDLVKKVLDINGVHRKLEKGIIPNLNLDFSNDKVRNSKRLQLADDNRSVQIRLQRYDGEPEEGQLAKGEKKTVI